MRTTLLIVLLSAAVSVSVEAQQGFWEDEPNNTKETATPALGIRSGDWIGVLSSDCPTVPDPDVFRIRTAGLPSGIYRHTLSKPGGLPAQARPRILGRNYWNGEVQAHSYQILQQSRDDTNPPRRLDWYGFGKAEELYVDLDSPNACRIVWNIDFASTQVLPVDAGQLPPSTLNISTFDPQGQSVDTELQLYDADYEALPSLGLDDIPTDPLGHASLWVPLAPGRYFLAVTAGDLASHRPPGTLTWGATNDAAVFGGVADFADVAVAGGAEIGTAFTVLIGGNAFPVVQTEPFEVFWFRFDVGIGQEIDTFCTVDDIGLSCPLGLNFASGSGTGCTNSTGRGADLVARRQTLSVNPVWTFTIEDLPPGALARLSFAFSAAAPSLLKAGYSCLGAGQESLGPLIADATGTATTEDVDVPALGFAVGSTVYAQAMYIDHGAPLGLQFNVSSGVSLLIP